MRQTILRIHLYLGLLSAVMLILLGITGSVIAFESDIERRLHAELWFVRPGASSFTESALIQAAETKFAPARVRAVQIFRERDLARLMQLSDGSLAYVNPYNGAVLGRTMGPTASQKLLGQIHQIHLRLTPDPRTMPAMAAIGKWIAGCAGLGLCLLVPTGFMLWWRTRRLTVNPRGSWFRMCYDAHHVIGAYAGLFLFVAGVTGVLIGFDSGPAAIYAVTHSSRPAQRQKLASTPVEGAVPIKLEEALAIALRAIPEASVAAFALPVEKKGVFAVQLRVPEETSESVHSSVVIDQYSGRVLELRNFLTDSLGYRVVRFNRSVHTGDLWGTGGHVLMSLSSLLLVAMAVTGLVIWRKKLAKD